MRIVAISDTHNYHEKLTKLIPEGDVLIHSGDMVDGLDTHEGIKNLRKISQWFGRLDFKKIICIAGNHDKIFESAVITTVSNAVYLEDSYYEFEGVRFYGSPWTLPFYGAFNASEPVLDNIYNKIQDPVDVLITHGPPKGILDSTSAGSSIGSTSLLTALNRIKPKLHIFGHVHYSTGLYHDNVTQFCNAAMAGKDFEFGSKKPFVFDI